MNSTENKVSKSLKRSLSKFNPEIRNEIISKCDRPTEEYNFNKKKSFISGLAYSKPKYIIVSVVIVMFLAATATYAFQSNYKFFIIGKKINKIEETNDTSAVALVGNKKITKKAFDTYKELYSAADNIPSDSALLDKLIENEVIYQEALKENISVSEEEINRALQDQKDAVAKDSEANEINKNLIQGKNISEEEHWKEMEEGLRRTLIIGKYINKLRDEFKNQNPDIQQKDIGIKFREYSGNKVNSLKNGIKVEKFIK